MHWATYREGSAPILKKQDVQVVVFFAGVSYFVYGEKIDIYSGTDPLLKEFMEAGMGYIRGLTVIGPALPLYRIYPTKPYREYEKIVRRMQRAGRQAESSWMTKTREIVMATSPTDMLSNECELYRLTFYVFYQENKCWIEDMKK